MKITRNPTDFEALVYQAVRLIPRGKVSTYSAIAQKIARGSARAVGTALAKNPFAPEVPCHRVIRADGHLGGFHGMTDGPRIAEKTALLVAEGIAFSGPSKVNLAASAVHQF